MRPEALYERKLQNRLINESDWSDWPGSTISAKETCSRDCMFSCFLFMQKTHVFTIIQREKYVESYWLTKKWIATAVYLKWMKNSAYYIENLSHSFIYWSFIFWFIEIHLKIEIFVCHESFFFWSSYLRSSLSLRSDFIKIAYSFSNSLISRWSRKSVNLKEIISIEWL